MCATEPSPSNTPNPNTAVEIFAREMLEISQRHQPSRRAELDISSLSLEQAYDVQDRYLAARVSLGEQFAGWKVGCTSKAIQDQFGLTQPICGRVLKPHVHNDGARLSILDFFDCAVEAEMVFHIGADLTEGLERETLRKSIVAVSPGIELHNYRFWLGKPTSQELIASNGIHAGVVVGARRPMLSEGEINSERMSLLVNGEVVESGIGADVMGSPLNSLSWLAHHLGRSGLRVRAGEIVIPGSAVRLVRVKGGDKIEASFETLGTCKAQFHG